MTKMAMGVDDDGGDGDGAMGSGATRYDDDDNDGRRWHDDGDDATRHGDDDDDDCEDNDYGDGAKKGCDKLKVKTLQVWYTESKNTPSIFWRHDVWYSKRQKGGVKVNKLVST